MGRREMVEFVGSEGANLAARLDLPAGPPKAFALVAHCFTCSKDTFAASRISAGLTARGFGVLRFDFTGLGSSDGDFSNTNFTSNTEDLLLAAQWLAEHHSAPQLLVGHSLGGAAVLSVAGELDSVRAVATVGAPGDVGHIEALFSASVDDIERDGSAEVTLGGRAFCIRKQFIDDLRSISLVERVASMKRALLILHSPVDNQVGIDNAETLFVAARHPKSFVSLDGADHLLTSRPDATFAANVIAAWAERYIEDQSGLTEVPPPAGQVLVAETNQGKFLSHVVAGEHHFLADEPESAGGFDAGPSPYDLLSAALGTCTSMTLRMYADRKKIPLDRVSVEVNHAKVHAEDCDECDQAATGLVDRLERSIRLEGDLTSEQRASLLAIADRCPVHRTLEKASTIVTSLT